jgi:hypothetical protein
VIYAYVAIGEALCAAATDAVAETIIKNKRRAAEVKKIGYDF